jgi:L-lactate dehydrogenase complex protein LldG
MIERPRVLQRIAERVRSGSARAPSPVPHPRPDTRPPGGVGPVDMATIAGRFEQAWAALAGHVHHARKRDDVLRIVLDICGRHDASTVLTWDDANLEMSGFADGLASAGVNCDTGCVPDGSEERAERLVRLAAIPVGITGARGAIAESGTIAVVSGPGRSRLASLLPPVHVALLQSDRIYATLPDFLGAHPDVTDEGSNLVLISGPSRTADIEMTLTRGVHGPGEVHVVVRPGEL